MSRYVIDEVLEYRRHRDEWDEFAAAEHWLRLENDEGLTLDTPVRELHPDQQIYLERRRILAIRPRPTVSGPMTPEAIEEIVSQISYKPGWTILTSREGDRVVLQVAVDATTEAALDAQLRDGTRVPWKSGKKHLSPHMCRQEIVGAVFGLIKDAESHEMREWFRYRGAAIYNPHLDPDVLVTVARKASSFNVRQNAMTPE